MSTTPRFTSGQPTHAVHLLRATIRDTVAPALRDLGFRGSGSRFALHPDTSEDYALVGVWADRYNDATLARFTLNLSYYTAAEWAGVQATALRHGLKPPAKPSPNEEYFCGWRLRVGYLAEPAHDHWWAIRDEDDAQRVAADVIRVAKDYVVPQLAARLAHEEPPPTFSDADHRGERCPWPYCYANDESWEGDY